MYTCICQIMRKTVNVGCSYIIRKTSDTRHILQLACSSSKLEVSISRPWR